MFPKEPETGSRTIGETQAGSGGAVAYLQP